MNSNKASTSPQQVEDVIVLIDEMRQKAIEYSPYSKEETQELRDKLLRILKTGPVKSSLFQTGQVVVYKDRPQFAVLVLATPSDSDVIRRSSGVDGYLCQTGWVKDGVFRCDKPSSLSARTQQSFETEMVLPASQPTIKR
jgi:hypothetical protein